MNMHLCKKLIVIFVIGSQALMNSALAAETEDQITEEKILSIEEALDSAMMNESISEYFSHVADDLAYSYEQSGLFRKKTVTKTRRDFEDQLKGGFQAANFLSINRDDRNIDISEDGRNATVTESYTETYRSDGDDIVTTAASTFKYELRNGAIVLTSIAYSDITTERSKSEFSEIDVAAYVGDGPASLEGEAFLRMESGNIKNCAGAVVYLLPATSYDLRIIKGLAFGMSNAMDQAGEAGKYWRESQCDSQGKFIFENLPVGEWVVITDVTFTTVDQTRVLGALTSGGGLAGRGVSGVNRAAEVTQGGLMGKRVTLSAQTNRLILTEQNLQAASFFGSGWPE